MDNAGLLRRAFAKWEKEGSGSDFFRLVSPTVVWRVMGTTQVSGTYRDRKSFFAATEPFMDRLAAPVSIRMLAIHDAGDTVVMEWTASSVGRNRRIYEQEYCWILHFEGGVIVAVSAYLDTALVDAMFEI